MKTDKIKLGDNREYTISEFDIGDFVAIEDKYGSLQLQTNKIGPITFWLWLAIRKSHKDLTLEKLYKLIPASFITDGGINKIFDSLSRLNGWDTEESKNGVSPVEKK